MAINSAIATEYAYSQCVEMHNSENYEDAFNCFMKFAEKGNEKAQCIVAIYYEGGFGVRKDEKAAYDWYLKSANNGNSEAQFSIGMYYNDGIYVQNSAREADLWLEKAANNGHKTAQYFMGMKYQYSTEQDDISRAIMFFTSACNNGEADACMELGEMYELGPLTPEKNYPLKALDCYLKAAKLGNPTHQYKLAKMYYPSIWEDIPDNPVQCAKWMLKAAQQGHSDAQLQMGILYASGVGVNKDLDSAKYWLRRALEQGNSEASKALSTYGLK